MTTSVSNEVYVLPISKVLALWFAVWSSGQKGMIFRSPFLVFFLLLESCLLSFELDCVPCVAEVLLPEVFCTSLT